jgi:hypothetical protein
VEQYLAAVREGRPARRGHVEIRKADLEDVFLDVMAAAARPCAPSSPRAGGDMTGWQTLFYKEMLRFWKVSFQTVAAPVLTAVLYLLIFGHVLEDHVKVYGQVSYTAFLVPGLVMMSVLQNAFANSSSSRWSRARSWATWCSCCSRRCRTGAGFLPMWARRWCAGWWWAPGC